jgi:methylated-DNA-[protein]-cysteine S-methyltransferase
MKNPSRAVQGLSTPVGFIAVVVGEGVIRHVLLAADEDGARDEVRQQYPRHAWTEAAPALEACVQLREFFHGERAAFDLPLDWSRFTPFANAILRELAKVPLGTTLTYGELAQRAGYPGRARAVGRVMAGNPYPILLPCHRIVGRAGRLTGYSGGEGLKTKSRLLDFEAFVDKNPLLLRKIP